MALTITVNRHPTEDYARIDITSTGESAEDLHDLDLIFQGLTTNLAREAKFEKSNHVVLFFRTESDFPEG